MRGICFIGAGKMATAIAGGMVRKNIKTEIHTFDPLPAAAEQFCKTCEGTAFSSPVAALENTDAVLLAVKPQYLTGAVEAIRDAIGGRLVISIVAGATIAALEALTGTKRIVRRLRRRSRRSGNSAFRSRTLPQSRRKSAGRGNRTQRKRPGVRSRIHPGACGRRRLCRTPARDRN